MWANANNSTGSANNSNYDDDDGGGGHDDNEDDDQHDDDEEEDDDDVDDITVMGRFTLLLRQPFSSTAVFNQLALTAPFASDPENPNIPDTKVFLTGYIPSKILPTA